ncbi:MAG: aryl-sulfate sulfotransferase [Peptococcaceae bacterium]|nr:aryl-sulfate sulfotransferase [Peptococcaceae bacterium]
MGKPSIHPTGTIIYKPEKCFNGYTLFTANEQGTILIDMNGAVVNCWHQMTAFPAKMLKGGQVMGSRGMRQSKFGDQDYKDLIQVDWDGNIVWEFKNNEYIEDPGYENGWMARQHHDYQREGNPVGYYVPGMECKTDSGNTLLLVHHDVVDPNISLHPLNDDRIIEVDWEGNILWDWKCHEHFDEMDFDEVAKNTIYRNPNIKTDGKGDWMHINSMSVLGPNKWYDAGDERFHPDNIIIDGRQTNIIAIIDKKTGKFVWKLGPDYSTGKAKEIGQIIGQHHAHMIPKGLPGEGNILVYDNGGLAGFGAPNPTALTGVNNARRDYSRVIEIDPVKMEIVWQCRPMDLGYMQPFIADHFYSQYISSAQRLPNGNTLIDEGSDGRFIEVTPDHEIVWEYISPYFASTGITTNMVYRAYRYPYDYVPQIPAPKEVEIIPPDITEFRLPGAKSPEFRRLTYVDGVEGFSDSVTGFCLEIEK